MLNAAILLCAGRGTRMDGTVDDKILADLLGKPVVCYSVNAFIQAGNVGVFTFVFRDEAQRTKIEKALEAHCDLRRHEVHWIQGGNERQDSVFNALVDLSLLVDYVFIHDCARPLVKPAQIKLLGEMVAQDKAAVLAHRVTDTIKKSNTTKKTTTLRTLKDVPRSGLWAMETPQAFERELITDAYRRIRFNRESVTDDTAAASHQGHAISILENTLPNPKLTVPADFKYVEFLLKES